MAIPSARKRAINMGMHLETCIASNFILMSKISKIDIIGFARGQEFKSPRCHLAGQEARHENHTKPSGGWTA